MSSINFSTQERVESNNLASDAVKTTTFSTKQANAAIAQLIYDMNIRKN